MSSVLQDWVMELPLREQGTILTGIRGCDLTPKNPDTLSSPERQLIAYFRFCVMNPADEREIDISGAFFRSRPPKYWKPSEFGHYPLHWFSHLMHCFEVVGYRHPGAERDTAFGIYIRMATSLHLNIETQAQMIERLSEDRVAKGTIVS